MSDAYVNNVAEIEQFDDESLAETASMLWLSWMTLNGEAAWPPLRPSSGPHMHAVLLQARRHARASGANLLAPTPTAWQHQYLVWLHRVGLSGALPSSRTYWFRTSSWHLPVDDAFSWTDETIENERDSECRDARLYFTSRCCIRTEGSATTTHRATMHQLVQRRSRYCAVFCRCRIRLRLSRKSWKWFVLMKNASSPLNWMGMSIWSVWPPSDLSSARPSFPQAWSPPRGDAGFVPHKSAVQWNEHHQQLADWDGKVLQCEQVWSFSVRVLISRQNLHATTQQSQSFCCENVCRVIRSFCWKRFAANGLAKEACRWQELTSGKRSLQQVSAQRNWNALLSATVACNSGEHFKRS